MKDCDFTATGGRPSPAAAQDAARSAREDARPPLPQRHHPSHNSVMIWPDSNRAVILFVTVAANERRPILLGASVRDAILAAWAEARNWLVGRYVFMPDHVHFFCAPGKWPIPDFHLWMRYWKRLSVQHLGGRPSPAAVQDVARAAREDARPPISIGTVEATGGRPSPAAAQDVARTVRGDARPPMSVGTVEATGGRPSSAAAQDVARAARGDARPPSAVGDNRPPKLWQDGCWDTQIRNGADYSEKWEYVRGNPVRKGLVAQADEWPWQGEINVLQWHE